MNKNKLEETEEVMEEGKFGFKFPLMNQLIKFQYRTLKGVSITSKTCLLCSNQALWLRLEM